MPTANPGQSIEPAQNPVRRCWLGRSRKGYSAPAPNSRTAHRQIETAIPVGGEVHIEIERDVTIPCSRFQQLVDRGHVDPQPGTAATTLAEGLNTGCVTRAELDLMAVRVRASRSRKFASPQSKLKL
jgi:hypothetical protein